MFLCIQQIHIVILRVQVGFLVRKHNTYCDDEDCIEGQRYHDDTYYSLYDEDGQEIDTKSWTTTYEKAAEIEDDIRNDKFIESHWDGLYERVVKQ